jgi:hypothetical protein
VQFHGPNCREVTGPPIHAENQNAARLRGILIHAEVRLDAGAAHCTDNEQQNDCADEGNQDITEDTQAHTHTESSEEPPTDEGADDTNQDGADQADTNTFDDRISQKASNRANDDPH